MSHESEKNIYAYKIITSSDKRAIQRFHKYLQNDTCDIYCLKNLFPDKNYQCTYNSYNSKNVQRTKNVVQLSEKILMKSIIGWRLTS